MPFFFFSSRRRHTRSLRDWSSDVCSSDLGSIVRFVGSDSIDRLVGSGPRGVTFSEFSLAKPSSWPLVRPILRENRGWATFLFTPRGHNHAYKLFLKAKSRPNVWFTSYHTLFDL